MTVNVHEAKTHFSRILNRVIMGEEVVIAKAGRPIARICPYEHAPTERIRPGPGALHGARRLRRSADPAGTSVEPDENLRSPNPHVTAGFHGAHGGLDIRDRSPRVDAVDEGESAVG